jgi:hypothetical protein
MITIVTAGGNGGGNGISGQGGAGGPVIITYEGAPKFIGGTIRFDNGVTTHTFTGGSAVFEPIRRSTIATRMACKTLSILEALNIVPKLPAIQNWWSAHKASDAARGIQSGGGGC